MTPSNGLDPKTSSIADWSKALAAPKQAVTLQLSSTPVVDLRQRAQSGLQTAWFSQKNTVRWEKVTAGLALAGFVLALFTLYNRPDGFQGVASGEFSKSGAAFVLAAWAFMFWRGLFTLGSGIMESCAEPAERLLAALRPPVLSA